VIILAIERDRSFLISRKLKHMVVLTEQADALQICDISPRRAAGECNGTFGELLQGVLPGERHFLVTLPVNLKSIVEFEPMLIDSVVATAASKTKSCRAVRDYLRLCGSRRGGRLHFRSTFPVGKGFASSSADMVAAIRAAACAYGLVASPETIEAVLRGIEPTDGVMYDGIVSFYHREVRLDERLGATPGLVIVAADRGGQCDTIEFNRIRRDTPGAMCLEYRDMLEGVKNALRTTDLRMLGTISSRSCELSQAFNPHPYIDTLRALRAETDALGLVATHSGTCIGLLYDALDTECSAKTEHTLRRLRALRIESYQYTTV